VPFEALKFSPFPFAFPDAQGERQGKAIPQPLVQKLADVFDRRVFQEVIPRSVIEICQSFPQKPLHVREIHHHSIVDVAFGNEFNLVRVAVDLTTFGMAREVVRTVDVLDNADFHAPTRIAQDLNDEVLTGALQAFR